MTYALFIRDIELTVGIGLHDFEKAAKQRILAAGVTLRRQLGDARAELAVQRVLLCGCEVVGGLQGQGGGLPCCGCARCTDSAGGLCSSRTTQPCEATRPLDRTVCCWLACVRTCPPVRRPAVVSTPADVVKTRLMSHDPRSPAAFRGAVHCFTSTLRTGVGWGWDGGCKVFFGGGGAEAAGCSRQSPMLLAGGGRTAPLRSRPPPLPPPLTATIPPLPREWRRGLAGAVRRLPAHLGAPWALAAHLLGGLRAGAQGQRPCSILTDPTL